MTPGELALLALVAPFVGAALVCVGMVIGAWISR